MINEITLIGNVGADPTIRDTRAGIVANVSVATTDKWKDTGGNWQEKTEWHKVVAFGYAADMISKYVKKGMQVYVNGSMTYSKYTNKDGIDVYTAEVKAQKVKILGRKESGDAGKNSSGEFQHHDNEMPF